MKLKKVFFSLIVTAAVIVLITACSGTSKTCPAYSLEETEITVSPNS